MAGTGKEVVYTYDFGDNWEHDFILEGRADATKDFVCLSGTGHPVAEDCRGIRGWEELKEAYRTSRPSKEQREKRAWFEGGASNGDPKGLAGDRVHVWDMEQVNRDLKGLVQTSTPGASRAADDGEWLRQHIMAQSEQDIRRLWKD